MTILDRPLTEDQIAVVMHYVLSGLKYLHQEQRKIHRDIKAGNILLGKKGEAKLGDFGVSGQLSDTMAKRQTVIGTPFWMAPEVIQEVGYDVRADIWSLGITCIEMAEMQPPYSNIHPMRAIFMIPSRPPPRLTEPDKWSSEFNDFVAKCLTKNPDERSSTDDLLKHPFMKRAKNLHLLSELVEQTMESIATAGGREAALGLDEESEDSESEDEQEESSTSNSAKVSSEEEDALNDYKTTVISEDTLKKNKFVPPYLEHLQKKNVPVPDYSGYSIEELQVLLDKLDGKIAEEVAVIQKKYMESKVTLSSLLAQS